MANGEGCIVNSNGGMSDCQWENDLPHGFGRETWDFGKISYTGNFYKGQKTGRGRFEWENGSYYEGEFENGNFNGWGVQFNAESQETYEGNFKDNIYDGKGKLTYADGKCYQGNFADGNFQGQGTMTLPNGDKYIGSWFNGVKHGIGIWHSQKTGEKRQGEWKNDKRVHWLNQATKHNGENNKILSN